MRHFESEISVKERYCLIKSKPTEFYPCINCIMNEVKLLKRYSVSPYSPNEMMILLRSFSLAGEKNYMRDMRQLFEMHIFRYKEVFCSTEKKPCIICSELCSSMQYTHLDSKKKIYMLCNKCCSHLMKS